MRAGLEGASPTQIMVAARKMSTAKVDGDHTNPVAMRATKLVSM
jgi:hypothetical protein